MTAPRPTPESEDPESEARLDKWLWHARFFKSRTQAAALCRDGRVRINGTPTVKAGTPVAPGDVLSFPQAGGVRVVRVQAIAGRRGPAADARTLYEEIIAARQP